MEDAQCPRCKTTKYRNPSLKLLVNVCGHSLCENCVDLLFKPGSGECPECRTSLRKNNFRPQLFDDAVVEKDIDIRKRMLKEFNKKEDDFLSLRDYNDYLELFETIVFNQTNGLDPEWTKVQIDKNRAENQQYIKRNRNKLSKDEEELEYLIEEEQELLAMSRQRVMLELNETKQRRQRQADELIDELMISNLPAEHIIQTHQMKDAVPLPSLSLPVQQRQTLQSAPKQSFKRPGKSSILNTVQDLRVPSSQVRPVVTATATQYVYTPLSVSYQGPTPPSPVSLDTLRYLSHVRPASSQERGGGFLSSIACQRALQDAFCGLYFSSVTQTGAALQP